MKICIYKITNPKGKIYIGQTYNVDRRLREYRTNHCKNQTKVYFSIKKYKWETHIFEILYEFPKDINQIVINTYETFYWLQFKEAGYDMLNIREPGSNGKHSQETKDRLSTFFKGRVISDETKEKMREKRKLQEFSLETRKKMSLAHSGKIGNRLGSKLTNETKLKIASSKKGKPLSEEHKLKLKGRVPWNKKNINNGSS